MYIFTAPSYIRPTVLLHGDFVEHYQLEKQDRDIEILGLCPAGPVLSHGKRVPLWPWLATLLVMGTQ